MSRFLLFCLCSVSLIVPGRSQTAAEAPAPSTAVPCNGIYLSYAYISGRQLTPTSRPADQPYRFESTITVQNNGLKELKSWAVAVGFRHREFLVSASNVVLADGTSLPAQVNNTIFTGYPATDLKTAFETAGDFTQTRVQISLIGTQFGVAPPSVPMPSNISLANDGFSCPRPTMEGRNMMHVCCLEDSESRSNLTVGEIFSARKKGDLTIMYDVIRTYESNYWAEVTIENHSPLGRLDNWKLSFDWMRGEFINAMRGAYPSIVDSSACLFGSQGEHYQGLDFSTVLSCAKRPTIVDLPPTSFNDTTIGGIQHCCRNGTVLPPTMDPSKSTSAFQMQVYKMPPDLNRSVIFPPLNWRINGTLNPVFVCGQPIRVSPSLSPDPRGLPSPSTAVASWQVACNMTAPGRSRPRRCCVSFSAYYNDSVIPCGTCACGCPERRSCAAVTPALLLPSQALLVPFENRTSMAVAWANIKRRPVPDPLPCGDGCGVSINWHVNTDYRRGWTARITLFNWGETSFADWFTAVQLDKGRAGAGFEAAYSFNGTLLGDLNNTIFLQGLPQQNYLLAQSAGDDGPVSGKQQTVISFTKRNAASVVNVAAGDGFPTKVLFNGEECLLPHAYPTSASRRRFSSPQLTSCIWSIASFLFLLYLRRQN